MSEPAVVIEDPAVARVILCALVRDTTAQLAADRERHRNGLPPRAVLPPQALLDELSTIAKTATPQIGSEFGTDVESVQVQSTSWATVTVAASRFDKSEEYTRRLARDGLVRSQRPGWGWLIDTDSMRTYLENRRTA